MSSKENKSIYLFATFQKKLRKIFYTKQKKEKKGNKCRVKLSRLTLFMRVCRTGIGLLTQSELQMRLWYRVAKIIYSENTQREIKIRKRNSRKIL